MTNLNINNKKFPLFYLDNRGTVINRIAYNLKTLPEFLCFPFGEWNLETKSNIVVKNLIDLIRSEKQISFENFWNKIKTTCSWNDPLKDVLIPYLIFNPQLNDQDFAFYSLVIIDELGNIPEFDNINEFELQRLWDTRDKLNTEIQNRIKMFMKEQKDEIERVVKFEKIKKVPFVSEFEVEKYTSMLSVKFDMDVNLERIFDLMHVGDKIPLVVLNNKFSKVLQKSQVVSPNINRMKWDNECICLLMNLPEKDIHIKLSNKQNKYILSWDEQTVKHELISNEFMNLFKDNIVKKISITKTVTKKDIGGTFYIASVNTKKAVMLDLITNNPFWNKIVWIKETEKTASKKEIIFVYSGYNEEKITMHFSSGKVKKYDNVTNIKEANKFDIGSHYTRVKIVSLPSVNKIDEMKNIISKLFSIYNENNSKIIKFYNAYGINIDDESGKDEKDESGKDEKDEEEELFDANMRLKDIEPNLFVSGYPTKCPNQPRVVTTREAENIKSKGFQVIKFPKVPTEAGIKPRLYSCDQNDKYIYPGLRKNTLKNSKDINVLPCCYLYDHEKKIGSLYRNYYYNEPITTTVKDTVITTDKLLSKYKYGLLPKPVSILLDDKKSWVRMGALHDENGNDSLLDCLSIILEKKITRKDVSKFPELCKQELWDCSVEEITKTILDKNTYLNPRLVYNVLPKITNCNVVIFSRIGKSSKIVFLKPRREIFYIYPENKDKTIMLYEHMGSRYDTVNHPICEIISLLKKDGSSKSIFSLNETKSILKLMKNNDIAIINNTKVVPMKLPDNVKVLSQRFDSYGKVDLLNIETKNGIKTSILIDPQIPIDVKEEKGENKLISIVDAKKVSKELNLKDVIVDKQNNVISGTIGNCVIKIPHEGYLNQYDKSIQFVDQWNNQRKLMTYLFQHLLYFYSIDNTKPSELTPKWLDSRMVIIPEYVYNNPNNLLLENNKNIKQGKVVVRNKKVYDMMNYNLKIAVMWNWEQVKDYKNKKYIENSYDTLYDFDKHKNETILKVENLMTYITKINTKEMIYNKPQPQLNSPYLFYNKKISSKVFIAKNIESINKEDNYKLWVLSSEPKSYIIKNNNDTDEIMYTVIGYKLKGKNKFVLVDKIY